MRSLLGMRSWLAATFALIGALSAGAVAIVSENRSQAEFSQRARDATAGKALSAAIAIADAPEDADLRRLVAELADRRRLAIFLFDERGRRLTAQRSQRIALTAVPDLAPALESALRGERFVSTGSSVRSTVVGLPLRAEPAAALVAYESHPEFAAGLGIVRQEVLEATLWAILLGGATGFIVATLIARRLRRIADAAAAIEAGDFDRELRPRFRDELGELAATFDRMRTRLRGLFTELKEERDRLEHLLAHLDEGVVLVRRDLSVEFANAEARRLLGSDLVRGDTLPEPWRRPSLRDLVQRLFEPVAASFETTVEVEDRVFALVGLPAAGAENALFVVEDVTDRERRERAEREFVANAAHELRTPLTTITGSVEALQGGAKEDRVQRDRFLGHIERESRRLAKLVRALLVLARAQTREELPRLEQVELRPLLEDAAADVAPARGVELEIRCPPGLTVATERDLVAQALANVVTNAGKYTREGKIVLEAQRRNGSILIEVSDTGGGMARTAQERAFERFYRGGHRNPDGFGLGLAIAREAVLAVGGRVEIESKLGVGTRVRVFLPADGPPA